MDLLQKILALVIQSCKGRKRSPKVYWERAASRDGEKIIHSNGRNRKRIHAAKVLGFMGKNLIGMYDMVYF